MQPRQQQQPDGRDRGPEREDWSGTDPAHDPGRDLGADDDRQRHRQEGESGSQRAVPLYLLQELRQEEEQREHHRSDDHHDQVRAGEAPRSEQPQRHERLTMPRFDDHERGEQSDADGQVAEHQS